ncbi:hypothetical protein ACW14Y_34100 [Kitasatospora sp. cg17-2]
MTQDDRHKYLCYAWRDNREQLFDLAKDPGELVDLKLVAEARVGEGRYVG